MTAAVERRRRRGLRQGIDALRSAASGSRVALQLLTSALAQSRRAARFCTAGATVGLGCTMVAPAVSAAELQWSYTPTPLQFDLAANAPRLFDEASGNVLAFSSTTAAAPYSHVAQLLRVRPTGRFEGLTQLPDSFGLDLDLPDSAGFLHLMLMTSQDRIGAGEHVAVEEAGDGRPQQRGSISGLWSLGSAIDYVDTTQSWNPGGAHERRISVAPQLMFDAAKLLGMRGDAVLTFERAYWQSEGAALTEPVMQVKVNWRF